MKVLTLLFKGNFTESEIKYVEECSKSLPERYKPYTVVKIGGRLMWAVD